MTDKVNANQICRILEIARAHLTTRPIDRKGAIKAIKCTIDTHIEMGRNDLERRWIKDESQYRRMKQLFMQCERDLRDCIKHLRKGDKPVQEILRWLDMVYLAMSSIDIVLVSPRHSLHIDWRYHSPHEILEPEEAQEVIDKAFKHAAKMFGKGHNQGEIDESWWDNTNIQFVKFSGWWCFGSTD